MCTYISLKVREDTNTTTALLTKSSHYYYNPPKEINTSTTTLLNKTFDFPCLRFVDSHCCPAMRTGRGFLARRAAVLHWGWP